MKYRTVFPIDIREVENFWISLSDGTKLAARAWMPVDAESHPVPAVLQYMPYRKRDFTASGDEVMHRYFAGHGYAAVRVDIRGSGDSDGLMFDEYDISEIEDGAEVVEWLAGQPWCAGTVGMLGNSWSGFNSLQVAAEGPPSLRAIITSCSTDDRYADDMHYMGGCLLTDTMDWGTVFFGNFPRPPDPQIVGERWREMWQARLDNAPLPLMKWLDHQRRDEYWKPGSVCEDHARIKCAVYACAGWLDGYSNTVARLLANLDVPRLGLVGPWKHAFPHRGFPGPAFNWLKEAVAWWDQWLKGIDSGIMDLPMYRAYLQEDVPTEAIFHSVPGRWVAEPAWPSPNIGDDAWYLHQGRLVRSAPGESELTVCSPLTTGLSGGEWCPGGTGGTGAEFATDQRDDDGKSLVFDTEPLRERYEILGAPVVEVDLASNQAQANLAVRLCDVAPNGASARVSFGVLNLSHREGHESAGPMEPGKRTRIRVQMNDCAHAFERGHRVRLALSTNYWPMVWPAPRQPTHRIFTGTSVLSLPHRPLRADGNWQPEPGEAEGARPGETSWLREGSYRRITKIDSVTRAVEIVNDVDTGHYRLEQTGLTVGETKHEISRIVEGDPTSAECIVERTQQMGREDNPIDFAIRTRLSCDEGNFYLEGTCDTIENGKRIHSKVWNVTIPRDHL